MALSQVSDTFAITGFQDRTNDYTFYFFEDDGTTPLALNAGDSVTFLMANERTPSTALLTLTASVTANGSYCEILTASPLVVALRLAPLDIDLSGTFLAEFVWIDSTEPSDTQDKELQQGTLSLAATLG